MSEELDKLIELWVDRPSLILYSDWEKKFESAMFELTLTIEANKCQS